MNYKTYGTDAFLYKTSTKRPILGRLIDVLHLGRLTSGSRFLFIVSQRFALFSGLGGLLARNLAIFAPISV